MKHQYAVFLGRESEPDWFDDFSAAQTKAEAWAALCIANGDTPTEIMVLKTVMLMTAEPDGAISSEQ